MKEILVYASLFGFFFGIFTRSLLLFGLPEICTVLIVSFALALLWRRRNEVSSAPYVLYASVFLLLFSCGALRMEWASWSEIHPAFEAKINTEAHIAGIVVRDPEVREQYTQLYVETEDELLLVRAKQARTVSYGDYVHATGTLQKPEAFETDLGRTFNYPGYLHARGVSYVLSFADVAVPSSNEGNVLIAHLLRFKHALIKQMEAVLPPAQAGLASGLLLGVKHSLGGGLEDVFRTAGITHIVVLSGYNIMLVVAFVMYVLAFILPYRIRLAFGCIGIVLFACLVGFSATVVRASIMAFLALFAKFLGRTYAVLRALLLACAVMLVFNPYLLVYDVGFQLSVAATVGLILAASYFEQHLTFMPTFLKLRGLLTATIATQVFVLPILLYQIGSFSVVSVVVNVLVLPMVPVAMLLSFASGLIGFVSFPLSQLLAYPAYLSLSYIIVVAQIFSSLPFASVVVPPFPFVFVLSAYIMLGLFAYRVSIAAKQQSDSPSLAGWTIEKEEVVQQKAAASRSDAAASVPIFFR